MKIRPFASSNDHKSQCMKGDPILVRCSVRFDSWSVLGLRATTLLRNQKNYPLVLISPLCPYVCVHNVCIGSFF